MSIFVISILVALIPMIPAVIYFLREKKDAPQQATRKLVFGLNAFNVVIGLMATGIGIYGWQPHQRFLRT